MSFLSPAFLLGLPLLAVPVLIHFFARKQRTLIRWGAMEFLFASATPRRRFLRWRDLLLLLLRVALVLAIVGALAQPMISSHWLGLTRPRDLVLVLDNSMSTARQLANGTVFEHEVDAASRLLQQLNATDTVRVLLSSPAPDWLTDTPVSGDNASTRALTARLRQLQPNDGTADMLECVQTALQAEPSDKSKPRFVTVVTDGQAHGWRASAPEAWAPIQALARSASPPAFLRVVVAGGSTPLANLAVEKLSATRPVASLGQPVTFTATIKNTGTAPSAATTLDWKAGETPLGISTVPELQPGVGTTVSLSQSFTTPGLLEVACQIGAADDLAPDNSARFLLEVTRALPVLLVEGEPQTDPAQSDTRYFLAALGCSETAQAAALATSVFKPKLIGYQHLRAEELSAFRCVVLANVPRLPAELVQKLARYVNAGGGLWIALGEQTDVAAFNQAFFESSLALAPLPLLQPIGDAEDREKSAALAPPAADNPATALLADTHRLDLDRVRIYRRHQFDSGRAVSHLVLLRAEGGAPVAIENDLGRGRVIVQGVPLGLAWCNLPLCQAYVVMVQEWLWHLTEPGLAKRNLQKGELLQASWPLDSSNGGAFLTTPIGQRVRLVAQEEEGRLVFRYSRTWWPGAYRLSVSSAAASAGVEKFQVSRDPEESNLTPLSPAQTQALASAGGLDFGTAPLYQPQGQRGAAPPKALAMWLLLALVLLMALELTMAFWLAHRRRATPPALVMEPRLRA